MIVLFCFPFPFCYQQLCLQRHRRHIKCFGKRLGISAATNLDLGNRISNLLIVLLGDLDLERPNVFVEVLDLGGAWDGEDIYILQNRTLVLPSLERY